MIYTLFGELKSKPFNVQNKFSRSSNLFFYSIIISILTKRICIWNTQLQPKLSMNSHSLIVVKICFLMYNVLINVCVRQETLIVWSEGENFDLALSFQEKAGCDEIWEKICQVSSRSLLNVSIFWDILSRGVWNYHDNV